MRETISRVLAALREAPVLLVIVLLNVTMMIIAGWYLLRVEDYRHQERLEAMRLLVQCVPGRGMLLEPHEGTATLFTFAAARH